MRRAIKVSRNGSSGAISGSDSEYARDRQRRLPPPAAARRRAPLLTIGRSPAAPAPGPRTPARDTPNVIYFMLHRLNILYVCEFFRSVCVQCEIFAR